MSEMILEHMKQMEAAVERVSREKRDAAIANAMSYAQGFAAGMLAQEAEKGKKGA